MTYSKLNSKVAMTKSINFIFNNLNHKVDTRSWINRVMASCLHGTVVMGSWDHPHIMVSHPVPLFHTHHVPSYTIPYHHVLTLPLTFHHVMSCLAVLHLDIKWWSWPLQRNGACFTPPVPGLLWRQSGLYVSALPPNLWNKVFAVAVCRGTAKQTHLL